MDEKMGADLEKATKYIESQEKLTGFTVRREGNELHLEKAGDLFSRLIPIEKEDMWRIEVFRQTEEWEIVNFTGTLEECLAFLSEHPYYLFWER